MLKGFEQIKVPLNELEQHKDSMAGYLFRREAGNVYSEYKGIVGGDQFITTYRQAGCEDTFLLAENIHNGELNLYFKEQE